MSARRWSVIASVALLLVAGAAHPQDRTEQIAGWTLSDIGHKPGDDSERVVLISKSVPGVVARYQPGETNMGGSINIVFSECRGLNYGSGFGFDDPPADRAAQVRAEIHEAFTDFAKSCPSFKRATEATLMAGFAEAFSAVDKLVTEHPFIYPPDPDAQPATSGDSV